MEKWRKYIPLIARCFRAVMLYPCFLAVWVLCMMTMAGFRTEEPFLWTVAAIFMPFIFFSVARVFAESDREGNKKLSQTQKQGFLPRALAVILTRDFWVDTGAVLGLFLILPPAAGFYHVQLVLLPEASFGVAKLILCALGMPMLLLLMLWARLSAWQEYEDGAPIFAQPATPEKRGPDMMMDTMARGQWAAHAMGGAMVLPRDDVETLSAEGRAWLRRENREKPFLLKLGLVLLLYALGGFLLFLSVPALISFWAILAKIGSVRWWLPFFLLAAVLGGFWSVFAVRAVRIRRRFLKNLEKLCAQHGFAFERMKRRYLSLFKYRDGANFRLHANGKTYDCKFFGAMRRHYEMYFHENGTLKIRHAFRFRRVEFFCFTKEYAFDYESEHEKLCIVAPVPNVISAGNERWNRPIDTGSKVGDYRIFSSTGFLNALQRDCIEKDQ